MAVILGIACLAITPVRAQGSAEAWAGTWQTDRGTWILEGSGDQVSGVTEADAGRLFGVVIGDRLVGGWAKPPSFAPPDDAGDLELTLDADGSMFTGRVRSGSDGEWEALIGVRQDGPGSFEPSSVPVLARADLPAILGGGRLRAIIEGLAGYLAVGSTGDLGASDALILISPPGQDPMASWTVVELDGTATDGDIWAIADHPGGFAAVGTTGDGAAGKVWLSPDGTTWEAITVRALAAARPVAVVEHDGGLVAVGCVARPAGDCIRPAIWTSADGRSWERSLPDLDPSWQIRDAASVDGRLILVGGTGVDESAVAVVATSDDAVVWDTQEVRQGALLDDVVGAPDGAMLAAGWRFGSSGAVGLLLRSDDGGSTWTDTGLSAPAGSLFTAVAQQPDETLVLGGSGPPFSETVPAAWVLGATGALEPLGIAVGDVPVTGIITDFAPDEVRGSGGIAVGIEAAMDGEQPAIWVVAPMDAEVATVTPTPEPTPRRTPRATPEPTPPKTPRPTATPVAVSEAERYLINGVAPRIRSSCKPKRDDLPDGTVAAILCTPAVKGVARVGYYLMSVPHANAVLQERQATYLGSDPGWGCDTGEPGIWSEAGFAGRAICYLDEEGRPNLRIVEFADAYCHPDPVRLGDTVVRKPTVYVGVLGSTTIRDATFAWIRRLQWNYPDGADPVDSGNSTGGANCGVPWPQP
jgi:hypothetical protein